MRVSDCSSDVCSADLVAGRRHIKQARYDIQLLLDYLSDILLQRRSFRPGICRPDREGGGRNRWILLNRKGLKRQYPGQNDAKRHDQGKNRQVAEETRYIRLEQRSCCGWATRLDVAFDLALRIGLPGWRLCRTGMLP